MKLLSMGNTNPEHKSSNYGMFMKKAARHSQIELIGLWQEHKCLYNVKSINNDNNTEKKV